MVRGDQSGKLEVRRPTSVTMANNYHSNLEDSHLITNQNLTPLHLNILHAQHANQTQFIKSHSNLQSPQIIIPTQLDQTNNPQNTMATLQNLNDSRIIFQANKNINMLTPNPTIIQPNQNLINPSQYKPIMNQPLPTPSPTGPNNMDVQVERKQRREERKGRDGDNCWCKP